MLDAPAAESVSHEAREDAHSAGLRYVADSVRGIRRRRRGKGFVYIAPGGSTIADPAEIAWIRSLAIPPAWTDVWICPYPNGHLLATGRDAKGRKQYRYHPRFREVRDSAKYEHLIAFAHALPEIRARIQADMALRGLPRQKILATIVNLLESTLIRVGNDDYARQNDSYGLTTLKNRHVKVEGAEVLFRFTGKSGKQWSLRVRDRRIARVIRSCQELPGQDLLEYVDEDGKVQSVTSTDVNAYLREITGEDITAKDFRTWAGTVLAMDCLCEAESSGSRAQAKKTVKDTIACVAARLGNTPTICRTCYVHPAILTHYLEGGPDMPMSKAGGAVHGGHCLTATEAAVLKLLEKERRKRPRRR